MRIISLVPHATELLFALDLGEQVVADAARVGARRPHCVGSRI
jgi:hypothetical protein